jgi:elongation factor G
VHDFLPDPREVKNTALDLSKEEEEVEVKSDPDAPLVALAFKLQESPFGQLTYLRVYSGVIRKGETVVHVSSGKKIKVPRLVRMHSEEMEDVTEAKAGEIVALFGVDCATGDSFTDGKVKYSMTSMHVPEPGGFLRNQPLWCDSSGGQSCGMHALRAMRVARHAPVCHR